MSLHIGGVDITATSSLECSRGDRLISNGKSETEASVNHNPQDALFKASGIVNVELVRLVLRDPRVNPAHDNNRAIAVASENGHVEVVRLLLGDSRVNPADNKNEVIQYALTHGHLEVVRLLLTDPRVNPADYDNWVIAIASGAFLAYWYT